MPQLPLHELMPPQDDPQAPPQLPATGAVAVVVAVVAAADDAADAPLEEALDAGGVSQPVTNNPKPRATASNARMVKW